MNIKKNKIQVDKKKLARVAFQDEFHQLKLNSIIHPYVFKKIDETYDKIKVIYNPTKNVHYDEKIKKNNDFLYVGRANDPIKRFHLVYDSLKKLEDSQRTLLVCGQQDPKFGKYLGYVSDEQLNELYNSGGLSEREYDIERRRILGQ